MATRRMLWQEKTVSIILWFSLPKKQTWRTRGRDENENAGRQETSWLRWITSVGWMKSVNWEACLVCALSCCLTQCVHCPPDSPHTHPDTSFISAPLSNDVRICFFQATHEWKPTCPLASSAEFPVTLCLQSRLSQLSLLCLSRPPCSKHPLQFLVSSMLACIKRSSSLTPVFLLFPRLSL